MTSKRREPCECAPAEARAFLLFEFFDCAELGQEIGWDDFLDSGIPYRDEQRKPLLLAKRSARWASAGKLFLSAIPLAASLAPPFARGEHGDCLLEQEGIARLQLAG